MDSTYLREVFESHHRKTVAILSNAKSKPDKADPLYGYSDLATYVSQGFKEPLDRTDLYLRLLACSRAERMALPSIAHMRALMSAVWANDLVPPKYRHTFEHICHQVSESLCYDIGKFATDSMKSVAATLHVEITVELGYQSQEDTPVMTQEPQKRDNLYHQSPTTVDGKPTTH